MDIVTTIPVRVKGPESVAPLLEAVHDRISACAFENFVERGAVDGHDLEDWLDAERQLIIKPIPVVRADRDDIFMEMVLPEIDLPNLTVLIGPRQLVIASDPDEDGLQVCQLVDLPCEILLDGVDAERLQNVLRVTAAVAG
jgi:hypothetical protein